MEIRSTCRIYIWKELAGAPGGQYSAWGDSAAVDGVFATIF